MLYPIAENRQKFCRRIDSKTPMLVAYPLPDKGLRYSIKAWEWTVYFDNGVWRCLRDDKLNNVLRFFLLNFNRQIRGHRRHKNIIIMKLKTVALIALIASILMLMNELYSVIYLFEYNFDNRISIYCGFLSRVLFRSSLVLFFYTIYKKS